MPKKQNNKVKKLEAEIEAKDEMISRQANTIEAITRFIEHLESLTNQDITSLTYEDPEQFETSMMQYTAIKRTLSILSAAVQTVKRSHLQGGA